jgi:hypothetical protein
MYRFLIEDLKEWAARPDRKPLVLRGARQVGKSFLVRMLAETAFENLAEVNFEQMPDAAELFASKRPEQIVSLVELRLNQSITPGKTLLFLDEIQATPEVFASLRYFYEQMPQLHVIAAGSLLEFVLQEHTFSMPVGRIEYMHLGPMTFEEFLLALDMKKMVEFLGRYTLAEPVPESIHHSLIRLVKEFCIVGGMPEAVKTYARTKSYLDTERVAAGILSTYRDDFAKYGQRVNTRRIEKVFSKIPLLIGQKLMYCQIDREEKSRDIKQAMRALEDAKIMYRVLHSDANGIPLGAETNERHFKTIFLDVGLVCRACGLTLMDIQDANSIVMINSGAICEQWVAQHLFYLGKSFDAPSLFCWMRQRGGSNAEVDYLITQGTAIIPVEVKAGKSGSLKSLHYFLSEKHRDFALRFNADTPSIVTATTSISGMQPQPFRLLSLPFYLVGQARRLCRENLQAVCV